MTLTPLGDRVLVRPDEGERVVGGVVIPDIAQERPVRGEVVAVGPGEVHPRTGETIPVTVRPGDRVLYARYGGVEVEDGDEDLLVLRQADVLAVEV